MIKQDNENFLQLGGILGALALLTMLALAASLAPQGNAAQGSAAEPWAAPPSDRDVKNPVPPTPENVAAGKKLYEDNCAMCHGDKGAGDGITVENLVVNPADLTDAKLMKRETDGSLFWKITTGRAPMQSWKDTLSDTQRWQLVDYIRTLVKGGTGEKSGAPGSKEH